MDLKKLLLILGLFSFSALGASSWILRLNVMPRPPQSINRWRTIPNIVSLRITYTGSDPIRVYLRARITHSREGVILEGNSRILEFMPGQSMFINNTDLVDWSSVRYSSRMEEQVRRTGRIPEGVYNLCVGVIPASGGSALETQCASFSIVAPSPPVLLFPDNGDSVELWGLVFRWTPVTVPPPMSVRYRLRIWEIHPGEDLRIATSRTPVLDEYTSATSFIYNRRITALHREHSYIWQVQAVDTRGNPVGENEGMSDIRKFYIKPRFTMIVILPNFMKIGNFTVRVRNYTTGSSLHSLSGNGRSFFSASGSRRWFNLNFHNLHADSTAGDTAFIDSGHISVVLSHPIQFDVAGIKLHISRVDLWADSAKATLFATHACLYDTGSPSPWKMGPFTTHIDTAGRFYKVLFGSTLSPFRIASYNIYIQPAGKVTIKTFAMTAGGIGPPGGHGGLPHGGFRPPGGTIYIPPSLFSWKGVKIDSGHTIKRTEMLTSNIGYLYGNYHFSDATLSDSGINIELHLSDSFAYTTIIPYNFSIQLTSGHFEIRKCRFRQGTFNAKISAPDGPNGVISSYTFSRLQLDINNIQVDSTLTFIAQKSIKNMIRWGNFSVAHEGPIRFRFTAPPRKYYSLIKNDTLLNPTSSELDTFVGMVLKPGGLSKDTLYIYSDYVQYRKLPIPCGVSRAWLVLDEQGVTANFTVIEQMTVFRKKLGRPGASGYIPRRYFDVEVKASRKAGEEIFVRFAGNSVFDARMDGRIRRLPKPTRVEFPFKKMTVTSFAYIIGGKVTFSTPQELEYWGVKMTSRSGYVSVRTGEVVFTDADISENVHFSKPFNLVWGEFLADGHLGKLYFNKNSAFQKFDGFPITLDSAALSKYDSTATGPRHGALVVRSQIHFKFFGEGDTLITVFDHKFDSTGNPFDGRYVYIKNPEFFGLKRAWGHNMALFDFDSVAYDTINQYAFQGSGEVRDIFYLNHSNATAVIKLDSLFASICLTERGSKDVVIPNLSFSGIKDIWGCAYIEGDTLKRVVIGGMVAVSTTTMLTTRAGSAARMTLSITPTITKFVINGKFLIKSIAGVEVEAYGKFTHNRQEHWVEGDLEGIFKMGGGIPLVASANSYAKGHFTFRAGGVYSFIQGDAEIKFGLSMGLSGTGMGINGGFFLGVSVPKERAWVLKNKTGRFGVDMRNLPARLTGFYAFKDYQYSLNLGLFGGEMEMFFGLGAMVNGGPGVTACGGLPLPYVVGDFGIYLAGKILWGLLSASGSAEAEFMGPCPFNISGTLTLGGCVLELLCASADINFGVSSSRGFYLE